MASSWVAKVKNNTHLQTAEEQRTIVILQDLFDGNINAEDAARSIASNYERRLKSGDTGTTAWALWTVVCHAIVDPRTGIDSLAQLAQMLIKISKLPDVVDDQGRLVVEDKRIFWHDVPEFSFWFREQAWNVHHTEDIDEGRTPITWPEQMQHFWNANAFGAMYLRALRASESAYELGAMRTTADWALMEALEVATDTPAQIRRTEIYVPAASQWILICGHEIFDLSKKKHGYSGETVWRRRIGGSDGGQRLWTGADGFSLERRKFWSKRFTEISALKGKVAESATTSATEAAKMMARIEDE